MSEQIELGQQDAIVHTPGPWAWFGNQHGIYLATIRDGRQYIMDFIRWGMRGAQPRFQPRRGYGMRPASELLMFAVGDQDIRGLDAAKEDGSVYRYDIRGIDCADARLIAKSPELFEFAESFVREWEATWVDPDEVNHEWTELYRKAKELIRGVNCGHSA